MNKLNNFETLEHHKGRIFVSKLFKLENRGNICYLQNGEFLLLAYVSPSMLENKDLDTLIKDIVIANGTPYMLLEDIITCSVCGNSYDEGDVNIVDYPDDVCVNCEKNYTAG